MGSTVGAMTLRSAMHMQHGERYSRRKEMPESRSVTGM